MVDIDVAENFNKANTRPSPMENPANLVQRIEQLNAIGIALSSEKNTSRLLELILLGAKDLTRADGGTLYLVTDNRHLRFAFMYNDSLNIAFGGTTDRSAPYDPVPLYDDEGMPNMRMVAAYAALANETVNIPDAYSVQGFDFSGTMAFDRKTGYRSQSLLTIPMKNHENELIGVLQLINARNPASGEITSFSAQDQRLVESLASQAAIALTNQTLINDLRGLLEKFVEVIAMAIDEKSSYTGDHCRRVPELAMMIADAACITSEGPLGNFSLTEAERYEMWIASLLHDCGKITTPVHIVDKATKLESIFDRIHLVDTRFEILRRDAEIAMLKQKLATSQGAETCNAANEEQRFRQELERLEEDRQFLRKCNIGSEYMDKAMQKRVEELARYTWINAEGEIQPLLTDNEVDNLSISKGTLTREERKVINNHIVTTLKMLQSLPFPKYLRNVPDIAGSHHERVDGKGFPRGLAREQMSVQARILAIADIFEALTAADRPYKKPMTLAQALSILEKMKTDGHIDPDLFDVFVREKIYLRYAEKFLRSDQIDEIDTPSGRLFLK